MLGAAVVAGGLGLGAVPAQAAEFGVYARGPVAYVSPCPGPGYVWAAGYRAHDYWVPGRWNFAGARGREPFARYEGRWGHDRYVARDRGWNRDHFRR